MNKSIIINQCQFSSCVIRMNPESGICCGSPSILLLPNGRILVSNDFYPHNLNKSILTDQYCGSWIHASDDLGQSWDKIAELPMHWSSFFEHQGQIYLMGVDHPFGSIVISRGNDFGSMWTQPKDHSSGLLALGRETQSSPGYHTAPVPIAHAHGRIWRAYEYVRNPALRKDWHAIMLSAPEDSNFLDAGNWTISESLRFDLSCVKHTLRDDDELIWLEGNALATADGSIIDLIRINHIDTAGLISVSNDGKSLSFDSSEDMINMPGGHHKFSVRFDPFSGQYLTLSNNNTVPTNGSQRNILSLCASPDLRQWRVVCTILSDHSGRCMDRSLKEIGFQYADWQFDGEDLICAVRVADGTTKWFHDANQILFCRIRNYRSLL